MRVKNQLRRRQALAEHFNMNLREILKPDKDEYQDEFEVRSFKLYGIAVEVLTFQEAIESEHSMLNDCYTEVLKFSGPDRIGMYARCINSDYYFRWL